MGGLLVADWNQIPCRAPAPGVLVLAEPRQNPAFQRKSLLLNLILLLLLSHRRESRNQPDTIPFFSQKGEPRSQVIWDTSGGDQRWRPAMGGRMEEQKEEGVVVVGQNRLEEKRELHEQLQRLPLILTSLGRRVGGA